MSKILSIDFGLKRVGLASANTQDGIAFTKSPITYSKYEVLLDKLSNIIENEEFNLILIGLPLGYENKETQMSQKIKNFAHDLQKLIGKDKEFIFWNEVLTSRMAGLNIKKYRFEKSIDSESARIFLQEFLDHKKYTNAK